MIREELNNFLEKYLSAPSLFVFMTGASGAGKTFLAKALEKNISPLYLSINYFDQIGVPSPEEMIRQYGCGEKWQEAKTHEWIERLAAKKDKSLIIAKAL